MKNNLVIIGFMATGKTSVAQALANKLGKEYVSTDDLIVKKANKQIPKIFEDDGEIKFRELEIEIVKKVSEMDDIVVDCWPVLVFVICSNLKLLPCQKVIPVDICVSPDT